MTSANKRRRYSRIADPVVTYDIEEVIGYKLVKNDLRFYVKWEAYDQSQNTWETLEYLENNLVFQEYIRNKFKSLEKDIYVNVCNIKQRLKKRIREAMQQPKAVTMVRL